MAIVFKGVHDPKSVVLFAVFFYVRYAVSYRDIEEIMAERRDLAAARRFFKKTISTNGMPDRVVIDRSVREQSGMPDSSISLLMKGD